MDEFLHHYIEILTNPAHLAVEVTLMVLVDVLFLGLIWPLLKRGIARHIHHDIAAEHEVIDAEHGIVHDVEPQDLTPYDHQVRGL